jgi:hypothetical protein
MNAQTRHSPAASRRLQLVLLLMMAWEALLIVAELSFGSAMFEIDGDKIGGLLGARSGFSGAAVVPIALYGFAFTRGPLRHPSILLVGVVQQVAAILFGAYHVAVDDVELSAYVVPLAVSLALFALLVVNMPRGDTA